MNELIKDEVLSTENINVVANIIKELPYTKLAIVGVGYLLYTTLKNCEIKATFKDFTLNINPAH